MLSHLTMAEARAMIDSGADRNGCMVSMDDARALEAEGRKWFKPTQVRASLAATPQTEPISPSAIIHEVCAIAGKSEAAEGFIAQGMSPVDVRKALYYAVDPSQTPVVKEATRRAAEHERLHGKAVAAFGRPQSESEQAGNALVENARKRSAAAAQQRSAV